jgi:mono/diheme cytochrome c family protein
MKVSTGTTKKERVQGSACLLLSAFCLLSFSGCRRDMQDQPKMKAYRSTTFFHDGLSARQPVPNTIARGYLREDTAYFTGKKSGTSPGSPTTPDPNAAQQASSTNSAYPDDVETFPFTVTEDIILRGQQRYEIFCSACHGKTGYGDGMIVRRGFRKAASFHDDPIREAPVGHYFDAITNGWGAMPSHATQIPVQDRWAIIAYIRALQLSQKQTRPAPVAPAASPTVSPGGHQ